MSALGAVLRIARRDARRARGRSLLVVAMIALPVLGVTAVDVVARTYELSPEQRASRQFGQADARYSDSGLLVIEQTGANGYSSTVERDPGSEVDLAALLPPGSRFLTDQTRTALVSVGDRSTSVQLRALAYADPLAAGMYRQMAGRPPAAADEVALTGALAERLDVRLGSRVRLREPDRDVLVVGLVEDQNSRASRTVLVPPDSLPPMAGSAGDPRRAALLVDVREPATWADVQAANARGVMVQPRRTLPGQPEAPGDRTASCRSCATRW